VTKQAAMASELEQLTSLRGLLKLAPTGVDGVAVILSS
jgi:hypothetical protein